MTQKAFIQSAQKPLHVVAVGSLTLDRKSFVDRIPVDEKIEARSRKTRLGGGGINFMKAFSGLAKIYNRPVDTKVITKLGKARPAKSDSDADLSDAEVDKSNHALVRKLLKIKNIDILDLMQNQYYFIPDNGVTIHPKGRGIVTYFENAAYKITDKVKNNIQENVKAADLLFVHTRYTEDAKIAIETAQKYGVPILIDYSVTTALKTTHDIQTQESLIRISDYIVAPAEAVLPAQNFKNTNATELMHGMINHYGAQKVAVSNNSDPVLVYDHGSMEAIPVQKVENPNLNGVGDTRNAALAFSLMLNADWHKALRIATTVASMKATAPELDFLKEMKPEDVPELYELVHGHLPVQEPTPDASETSPHI